MPAKIQLVIVTEWINRTEALRFARNTREFDPLFITRKKWDRAQFAVCRSTMNGESVPASHSIFVSPKDILRLV